MTSIPPTYVREVKLHDLDGRGHEVRVLRDTTGQIFLELAAKHGCVEVFSTLRLGDSSRVFSQLIPLK
jgi:hypothetical protein